MLVERYQNNVFGLALKISNSREDAEEIAQDTFMKAFNALDTFKHKSSFATWLYRITYNSSITEIRKKKYNILQIEDFPADANDFIRDSENEEIAEREYKTSILNFAIQKLSSTDRAIISLYYYQDVSIEVIAGIIKTSKSNVKVKLHRARKRIEEIICKRDFNESVKYEELQEKL